MTLIRSRDRSLFSSNRIPVALFLVDVAFGLWVVQPGLASKSLWRDDGNHLSGLWPLPDSYFAGLSLRGPIFRLFENLDILFLRLWFISIHAAVVVALYVLFARLLSKKTAVLVALIFSTLWFDPMFGLFVIGSEGPATSLWMVALVLLFDRFMTAHGRESRINSALLLGVTAFVSVFNAFYAPLLGAMPFIWIGFAAVFRVIDRTFFLWGLLAGLPALIATAIYRITNPNHYFGLGWTETSVSGAWGNLSRLRAMFFSSETFPWEIILALIVLSVLLAAADYFFGGGRTNRQEFGTLGLDARRSLVLVLVALSLAVTVIAPVLMVSVPYAGRYSWAIATASLMLVGFILFFFKGFRFANAGVFSVLICLVVFGGFTRFETQRATIEANLVAEEKLKILVQHEAGGWPIGSQIVVITDKFSCCGRFNHWSTGNLASLSGRDDLKALIGPREELSRLPFVTLWLREGWWVATHSGKLKREPMKGLEVGGGGIFVYDLDQPDFMRPMSVNFLGPQCELFLSPGSSVLGAHRSRSISDLPDLVWTVDSCLAADNSARN